MDEWSNHFPDPVPESLEEIAKKVGEDTNPNPSSMEDIISELNESKGACVGKSKN
ncbi:hypothetical protein [Spirochaeta cellobiosiphila]|uniref:hypothetical protein n=1 Tax=Spirochaeta cellobiosiphila TaxID=504483 RepID=UPI00042A8702|nr:hypothetical protein [Spirochaeta cellobiosiphila]